MSMMCDDEDDAFNDIERMEQLKVDTAKQRMFEKTFHQVVRNETIEEIAREFETFTHAFGVDTVASFQIFVRAMKT
jgi:ASC-1-like (ASCH) protein